MPGKLQPIPGESRHLPELDGIRGLAILGVLLSHGVNYLRIVDSSTTWGKYTLMALLPGWGGVDLFFTLSGFLITGILLHSRRRPSYFSSFYGRRVLRIFPIYYLFLSITLVGSRVSPLLASQLPSSASQAVPFFFYVENWPVFWKNWAGIPSMWGIFWSLAVEEQFYLLWPALVRWLTPRTLFWLCIGGFLCGWPVRATLLRIHGLQFGVLEAPFSRLDGLLLGAALALFREIHAKPLPLRWAVSLVSAGGLLYGCVALAHPTELQGAGTHLWTMGITAFALLSAGLIAVSQHRPVWLQGVLTSPPLRSAGTYSYGMYVYHLLFYFPIASLVSHRLTSHYGRCPPPQVGVVVLVSSIFLVWVVAGLSFRFIERPLLSLKRLFPSPPAVTLSAAEEK